MSFPPVAFPDDVPVLGSGDVVLRAHREDDLDALVEQCLDEETLAWTTIPRGYDADKARDFLGLIVPGGGVQGPNARSPSRPPHLTDAVGTRAPSRCVTRVPAGRLWDLSRTRPSEAPA